MGCMDVGWHAPPLMQSMEFNAACKTLGLQTQVHIRDLHEHARCSCLVQLRRLPLVGQIRLISRGPVCPDTDTATAWLKELVNVPIPTLVNGEIVPTNRMQSIGLFPILTPASIGRVRIAERAVMRSALTQKWRNRLVRAENADLSLRQYELPAAPDHWLLHAEAKQQQHRRYRNLPRHLLAGYAHAAPGKAQVFEAWQDHHRLAGILILRHGLGATYQIGVTSPAGRRLHAHNFLIWSALRWLNDIGAHWLELGSIDQKTAPDLARFKLGTGARIIQLTGTSLYHPALAPIARHLPKYLMH